MPRDREKKKFQIVPYASQRMEHDSQDDRSGHSVQSKIRTMISLEAAESTEQRLLVDRSRKQQLFMPFWWMLGRKRFGYIRFPKAKT